jgi:hypothetical protein
MTAKKRPARRPLPPMPLSELPMMKALLALTGGTTTRRPSTKRDSKEGLTMLRLTIIDKLQVLALRRPQALVIIAQVLDSLLDEQLNVLDGVQLTLLEEPTSPTVRPVMAKANIRPKTKRSGQKAS